MLWSCIRYLLSKNKQKQNKNTKQNRETNVSYHCINLTFKMDGWKKVEKLIIFQSNWFILYLFETHFFKILKQSTDAIHWLQPVTNIWHVVTRTTLFTAPRASSVVIMAGVYLEILPSLVKLVGMISNGPENNQRAVVSSFNCLIIFVTLF